MELEQMHPSLCILITYASVTMRRLENLEKKLIDIVGLGSISVCGLLSLASCCADFVYVLIYCMMRGRSSREDGLYQQPLV
jgi:hypothetical protein